MENIQKILCPVDCSEPSVHALRRAAELAQHFQAELILLNVIEPHASGADPVALGTSALRGDVNERKMEAYCDLMDLVSNKTPDDVVVTAEVAFGQPAEEIIDRAGNGVDIIVMSTHGRTGLKRLMYGSVTNAILRSAPCPVLTVPWIGEMEPADATHRRLRELMADHPGQAVGAARTLRDEYLEHRDMNAAG